MIRDLNALLDVPFEQWPRHGFRLRAVSANADGKVNSGVLSSGQYFYRKWEMVEGRFTGRSSFVTG